MYLSETNPHVFIQKFVQAISEGWRAVPSNEGYISQAFLLELKMLPKEENEEVVPLFTEHKIVIEEWDSMSFLLLCQNALLSGYSLDMKSLDWNSHSLKRVKAENRSHPHAQDYDFHFLNEVDWDELKAIAKTFGITGRNRLIIVNAILAKQGKFDEQTTD